MKKKFTLILTIAMIISLLPVYAFATEDEGIPAEESTPTYSNEVAEVDGSLVYFNAAGEQDMSAGWKYASNGTYYSNGSALVTQPTRIRSSYKTTKKIKQYYNRRTKKWQTKYRRRAKKRYVKRVVTVPTNYLYMFGEDGKLIGGKGFLTYNGNEYYRLGGGALKTGWLAVGNTAMYFYPANGRMAKGTKVGYLSVPANGRLGEAYALGVRKLDKTGWSLRQAYKNSYKIRYRNRWYRAKNAETYAIRGFKTGKGNCFVMASTFYIQAKLLGYDVHQVKGRAGVMPHSWTVIRHGNREWVYDPNFKNETGRNGFKIWYKKKGTWRYNHYSKMN